MTTDNPARVSKRPLLTLVASNILGGVGVASGIAVGALLIAELGGTAMAGLGQAVSVLGAGIAAVPLAALAARHGRRRALTLGYSGAVLGGLVVIAGATAGSVWLTLLGLVGFGFAQATNLQARYAASEVAAPERRGRTMSFVVWATTIGSVVGPNLSELGASLGARLGVRELAGPYLFSVVAFTLAGTVIGLFLGRPARTSHGSAPGSGGAPSASEASGSRGATKPVGALAALVWAMRHPRARFGVVLLVAAHAVMVGIMSMTPVHLGHGGHGLRIVGLVISAHILGMYALSPVFGWAADRIGALKTALGGLLVLGASAAVAFAAPHSMPAVMVSLTLLGLGWSAATISASVLLAGVDSGAVRVPLQGATDALMSYGGATAAILSGPLLAWVGFGGLAMISGALIIPAAAIGWIAYRVSDARR
ncbi:MAG: MFS transporter [Propioniciclava sp.]|uniref:MFS transporter n=1 Tax=Propioniciclava sp. TaxID=2038686 RepID=UPI0039E6589A